MSAQPYIPLYIGDWQRDTNLLTLEAEGALLKLIFKLWDSSDKGRLLISFSQLSLLLKKSPEITREIMQEIAESGVLNIEIIENNRLKIESRRMLKELDKSLKMSENGKKGGRPKKAKQKQTESKVKAKQKQITDNDIDNDIESEIDFVIEYLNVAAKRNFKLNSKLSRKDIRARLKDGYTKESAVDVIDFKCAKWLDDKEMAFYLRPQTLFTAENFEKYCQEVELAKERGYTLNDLKPKQNGQPNANLAEKVAERYRQRAAAERT